MKWLDILGIIAGTCTTLAFLPQAVKTWQSRSAGDLSMGTFMLLVVGLILWLIYGIILYNWPIILTNGFTLLIASSILYFKFRYP
ncbi:MAG: SemiSWEET transporter [Bacteroidota bacterium]